jgi:predicted transcriptional regulator of viral defense system
MPRASYLDSLVEIANEQGGYVTAAQGARIGVPQAQLARLAESGDLRRVRWGVYAMRHAQHRLEDEISAWLALDRERLPWQRGREPAAVLSHASAASLHNLGTVIPQLPALTVPPARRRSSRGKGIDLHVAPLSDKDWEWLRIDEAVRLPVTTPSRTIVDLIAIGEEPSYIARAIRESLHDGRLSRDDLMGAAERRKARNAALRRRVRAVLDRVAA